MAFGMPSAKRKSPLSTSPEPLLHTTVVSDEFEPVSARTMKLPFMPCPTDATQRERQRG